MKLLAGLLQSLRGPIGIPHGWHRTSPAWQTWAPGQPLLSIRGKDRWRGFALHGSVPLSAHARKHASLCPCQGCLSMPVLRPSPAGDSMSASQPTNHTRGALKQPPLYSFVSYKLYWFNQFHTVLFSVVHAIGLGAFGCKKLRAVRFS